MSHFDAVIFVMFIVIGLALFGLFVRFILTAPTFQEALRRGAAVALVVGLLAAIGSKSVAFALGKVLGILLCSSIIYGLKRLVLKFRKAPVVRGEKAI